ENGTETKKGAKALLDLNTRGTLELKSVKAKVAQQVKRDDPVYERGNAERASPIVPVSGQQDAKPQASPSPVKRISNYQEPRSQPGPGNPPPPDPTPGAEPSPPAIPVPGQPPDAIVRPPAQPQPPPPTVTPRGQGAAGLPPGAGPPGLSLNVTQPTPGTPAP